MKSLMYLFDIYFNMSSKNKIREYLTELSHKSVGVPEFLDLVEKNPDVLEFLNFKSLEDLSEYVLESDYTEFNYLREQASRYLSKKHDTIQKEMPEIVRTSKELKIDLDALIEAFRKSKEIYLSKKIHERLENTESNQIKKGEMDKAISIAKKYGKKDPKKIKIELSSENYDRPLILNFNNRYYLVAGNTRLSTAAAMGMKPKIYLASL